MPKTAVKHGRNVTLYIEAHGERLFPPNAPFGRWASIFEDRIVGFTKDAAPFNKRPHWAHYGVNLRNSFDSKIAFKASDMRIDIAVGSSAGHALYVDQGTGVFGGNGPYLARILPPWTRGGASLYESTWRPAGPRGRRVSPVMIKGQPGQKFFDKGLTRAMQSMALRATKVPGDPRIANVMSSFPTQLALASTAGNPNAGAFTAQLKQWRDWRDARWNKGGVLGKGRGAGTAEWARRKAAKSQAAKREKPKAKKPTRKVQPKPVKPKPDRAKIANKRRQDAIKADRYRFMDRVTSRFPSSEGYRVGTPHFNGTQWVVTVISRSGKERVLKSSTKF